MTSPSGDSFLKCSREGSMRFCKFSSRDFHQPDEIQTVGQTHDSLPQQTLKNGDSFKEKRESMTEEYQCGCKPQVIPFDKENNWQVLLVGKLNDNECFPILSRIIKLLKERECSFYAEGNSIEKIKEQLKADQMEKEIGQIHHFESKKHELIIDLIITLGGDGTILYAMSHFQRRESPPIIALEKGTLGFMCMYQIDNIEKDFTKIQENIRINKNLMVERKMRIQAVVRDSKGKVAIQPNGERKEFHALNEIVVDRGQNASCLKMEIFLNNENLTKTLGDGLIFSTPTGSTAYSLSAGGPIIQNEVRSISLVPICPFSLSFRPIVLPPCSELRVKLSSDNRGQGKISGDGQKVFDFLPDEMLSIQSSDIDVLVVRETYKANNIHEWMIKLRKMLNWNSNFSK